MLLNFYLIIFIISFCSFTLNAQWISLQGPPGNAGLYSLAVSGSTLFSGTEDGLYFTSNNGEDWMKIDSSAGLTNNFIYALAVSGNNIFAGTQGGGVFLSIDNGTTWSAKNSGLNSDEIFCFALSGSNIFVGTSMGVFISTDNGENWIEKNNGLQNGTVRALTVSPTGIFAAVNFNIYFSENNGDNWVEANSGLPASTAVYSLAALGSDIFAGLNGRGVYFSNNNGTIWSEVNTGLTNDVIWALTVSGSNIFAGTDDGVFFSTNNGTEWISTEYDYSSAFALAVSTTDLYAGGGFLTVFRRPLSEFITDISKNNIIIPKKFILHQNFPNPFNPITNIEFSIPNSGFVSLKIYDMLGKQVEELTNDNLEPGTYTIHWNAVNFASGVYIYQIEVYSESGIFSDEKKLILLK